MIEAGNDDEPEPTPPGGEELIPVEEEEEAVKVAAEVVSLLPRIKEAIANNLSLTQLQNILSIHELNTSGNQKTLRKRFTSYCETVGEVELESIWEYLNATENVQAA